jgi:hypothetical protein
VFLWKTGIIVLQIEVNTEQWNQFYAVEIARNRKGLNDWIFEEAEKEKEKEEKGEN